MTTAALVGLCAGVGAVLGWFVPTLIRVLPEPAPDEERPEEDGAKEPYVDLAGLRWVRPLSVVGSAVAAGLIAVTVTPERVALALVPFVALGVLLGVVDARTRLLPRRVVLPATALAVVLVGVEWVVTRETEVVVRALIAMLATRTVFWVLWFVRRAGMGFGDVRLAALVGLVLGRLGWTPWLIGVYAGMLLFALFAIGLAVVRRDRSLLRGTLPYGPFMLGGALVGLLFA